MQSAVWRAVCLLVLGALLVSRSEEMPVWLVKAAGILLIVPGLVSVALFFRPVETTVPGPGGQPETRRMRPVLLPAMGLAAVALGAIVFFMAGQLVNLMMYVLSGVLIVASSLQCVELLDASRRGARIPPVAFAVPVLVLALALLVVLDVEFAAAMPFVFIGAGCLAYGFMELWTALMVYLLARRLARAAAAESAARPDAEPIESIEAPDDDETASPAAAR